MIDDFLGVVSDCVERDLRIKESPAVSILCDESTDTANLKQLVVFVCFLVKGKPQTSYLKVVDLVDGTAESIVNALLNVCSQCEIALSKVFSFGSDGASVMTGKGNSIAKVRT